MNATKVALTCAAAVMLCGFAGLERIDSYKAKGNRPDVRVEADGQPFRIWLHPTDDALLITLAPGKAIAHSLVSLGTLGAVSTADPKPVWKHAAERLTAPVGCTLTDVYELDRHAIWEATYSCPAGVDLRAKVAAQRDQLSRGEPIQP